MVEKMTDGKKKKKVGSENEGGFKTEVKMKKSRSIGATAIVTDADKNFPRGIKVKNTIGQLPPQMELRKRKADESIEKTKFTCLELDKMKIGSGFGSSSQSEDRKLKE